MSENNQNQIQNQISEPDIRNVLLVIDLQRQFRDADETNYRKCITYIAKHQKEYSEIIGTVFSRTVGSNDNFVRKLGWNGCINCNRFDLDYQPGSLFIKSSYSPIIENYGIHHTDRIYLMGCDAEACILASAFYLFDHGYDFYILNDYIYSSSDPAFTDMTLKILYHNFGKCFVSGPI